jgi:hypothetical protein
VDVHGHSIRPLEFNLGPSLPASWISVRWLEAIVIDARLGAGLRQSVKHAMFLESSFTDTRQFSPVSKWPRQVAPICAGRVMEQWGSLQAFKANVDHQAHDAVHRCQKDLAALLTG